MESDEKRLLIKDFNHRINNDLQALLAFIKIQKRFDVDADEIINFTCVSIASISSIQNMMYYSQDEDLISIAEFFDDFIKILEDQYIKFNVDFSCNVRYDFMLNPKKMFQLMFLITDMVNQSIAFSFAENTENKIDLELENNGEECHLNYSDNGSGIRSTITGKDIQAVLFDQLLKQIDGTLESGDDSIISIIFKP